MCKLRDDIKYKQQPNCYCFFIKQNDLGFLNNWRGDNFAIGWWPTTQMLERNSCPVKSLLQSDVFAGKKMFLLWKRKKKYYRKANPI
jgi:hypothetical protein